MKYRLLGQTGLYVSELCLGCMTFGNQGFWKVMGGLELPEVKVLVRQAFEAGINFFDTANVYSLGESERLLGQAIKALGLPRDQMVIATKATGIMTDLPNGRGQSRFHLMQELDASLKRLQVDCIDLYQLHGIDPLTPIEETLSTLNDMVRSGKVRYIGLCNMAAWQIMQALAISEAKGWSRFVSVQSYYSLAGRDLERELIPLIEHQRLGLMVWSPLAGGLLSGKFSRDGQAPAGTRRASFDFPVVDKNRAFDCVEALRPMAERRGVTVARLALAWLLSRSAVSSVILGARTLDQLQDNLAASDVIWSDEELALLAKLSQLPPEYPGWMLERQAEYRQRVPVFPSNPSK